MTKLLSTENTKSHYSTLTAKAIHDRICALTYNQSLFFFVAEKSLVTNSTKASHADVSLSACHYGHVYYNYSLLYGRKAGNFTDRGKVKNMSECLRICCKDVSCKIALMLELNCYSVACYGKFCQTVPVKPFQFKPKIAHVIRRKGKSESGVRYALTKRIKW